MGINIRIIDSATGAALARAGFNWKVLLYRDDSEAGLIVGETNGVCLNCYHSQGSIEVVSRVGGTGALRCIVLGVWDSAECKAGAVRFEVREGERYSEADVLDELEAAVGRLEAAVDVPPRESMRLSFVCTDGSRVEVPVGEVKVPEPADDAQGYAYGYGYGSDLWYIIGEWDTVALAENEEDV